MAIDMKRYRSQLVHFDSRRCWHIAEYELPDEVVSTVRNDENTKFSNFLIELFLFEFIGITSDRKLNVITD